MSAENPAECFRLVENCALEDQVYTIGYTDDVHLTPDSIRGSLTSKYPQALRVDRLHHRLSMILLEAGRRDEERWGGYPSYDGGHNMVVPVGRKITAVYDFPYEPNEGEPYLAAVLLNTGNGISVAKFSGEDDEDEDRFSTVIVSNNKGQILDAEACDDRWAGMDKLHLHQAFFKATAEMIVDWLEHREDKPKISSRVPFQDTKTEALYQAVMSREVTLVQPQ